MSSNSVAGANSQAEVEISEIGAISTALPDNERYLINRLGYRIEVRDNLGRWLNRVTIVDDNGLAEHINGLAILNSENSEIGEVTEALVRRAIETYLPLTLRNYIPAIIELIECCRTSKSIAEAIKTHLTRKAFDSENAHEVPMHVAAAKQLTTYLIAYEYPDFSFDDAEEILSCEIGIQSNNYQRLYLMDNVSGPFSREEMGIIRQALDNDDLPIPLDSRVVTQLCLEWGLRPIQLALLKESDFYYNPQNNIFWLNVPRVKQRQKARRGQFKRRMISERLGLLIIQMIENNKWTKAFFGVDDMPLFQRRFGGLRETAGVSVVANRAALNPNTHLYPEPKEHFSFHIGQRAILRRIKEVESVLPDSPRTKSRFNLHAYRFRYTLGTASVAQGMTADEVAERLDHSNPDSVKHYFKNTEHLWEVIQSATSLRVEQKDFVARFMSKDVAPSNMYSKEITERKTFSTIGGCHKGTPCHLEPAVACYSCPEFKPNDNVDGHKRAREVILEQRKLARDNSSTGEIRHVLDDAYAGVEAAIRYAVAPDSVFNINDGIHNRNALPLSPDTAYSE